MLGRTTSDLAKQQHDLQLEETAVVTYHFRAEQGSSIVMGITVLIAVTLGSSLLWRADGDGPSMASAAGALPPLPAGWPTTLQLGMADFPGGAAAVKATAPFGFRYQYLSAGVNTGKGWATWNANGQFVTAYIQESMQNAITPVFTYYMIRQSAPGNTQDESTGVYTNLQNQSTMVAYFNDLKLFFQRAGAFSSTSAVLHVEPDMWGYLQQRATGDNASSVPAKVAATGLPELAGLPDNVSGLARAIVKLRDQYAPNVSLGYHMSGWGTGTDITYAKPPDSTVQALAVRSSNFYLSLQASFDLTFSEFSDRDAGFRQYVYGDNGASWWGPEEFRRNTLYLSTFNSLAQKRMVIWQIPFGNTKMRAMNNTWDHYQDNRVEWLLDDAQRMHLNDYLQAGIVAFLFGRGADGATCACDAAGDGTTNPAPINGNTSVSLNADDDGGFFKQKGAAYYTTGAMVLPSSSQTPVATAAASATSTLPARTATPLPTAGPGSFVLGVALNTGSTLTVDGQQFTGEWSLGPNRPTWSGNSGGADDTGNLAACGTVSPPLDAGHRALMQHGVYQNGGTGFALSQPLANGQYAVYLYVGNFWPSHNHQENLDLEGARVANGIGNLATCSWGRYGPYAVLVADGHLDLQLTNAGTAASTAFLNGYAIYRTSGAIGSPTALATASRTSTPRAATSTVTATRPPATPTIAPPPTASPTPGSGYTIRTGIDLGAGAGDVRVVEGISWQTQNQALASGMSTNASTYDGSFTPVDWQTLTPPASADAKHMLASVIYRTPSLTISYPLPNGTYGVAVWSLNDGHVRDNNITIQGVFRERLTVNTPWAWVRGGIYPVTVTNGVLTIDVASATGGEANLSGFAIYSPTS